MEKVVCEKCQGQNSSNAKYCSSCGSTLPATISLQPTSIVDPTNNNRKAVVKKVVFSIAGAIAFGLAYYATQQLFSGKTTFDNQLTEVATELNKQCPIMVDQDTRLDNAIAFPGNILQYNYTLVNFTKSQINIDTLKRFLETNLLNTVRTSPDLERFRKNKTTLSYSYKDKEGIFIHKYTVTPNQYSVE